MAKLFGRKNNKGKDYDVMDPTKSSPTEKAIMKQAGKILKSAAKAIAKAVGKIVTAILSARSSWNFNFNYNSYYYINYGYYYCI